MTAPAKTRTTTVRVPRALYEQAKAIVDTEREKSSITLNDLFVTAITAYLQMYKRRQIDAAFAGMANDADYQKEANLITEEFEHSDWEALRLEEDLEAEPTHAASATR